MKIVTKIVIILLIFSITSCQKETVESIKWIKPDSFTISCEDYFSQQTNLGILNNNVWNKQAAKENARSQCIEKREVNGITQYGWSWTWPANRRVIYSYPQIKIGASPWAPEPKFDNRFPLEILSLKTLNISYNVETITNGEHNLATTMWLTNKPYSGNKPDPSVIAAEFMIWTYTTKNHFNPAGEKYSEIKIGNTLWEVWFNKNWSDTSGVNDNKWAYLTFKSDQSFLKADFNALKMLEYAIQEKLIDADLFIADVELGNEVMSGSGMTWIKEFNVLTQ